MADIDLQVKVGTSPKDPFGSVNKELDQTDSKIKGVESGFGSLGGAAAAAAVVIAGAAKAFDFIVDATRQMEDLQTQFIAFTGSAQGAADQVARLSEFASTSPFSLSQVAEANRTLLAFGQTTSDSLEQLRQLGEVSAATGTDLGELARIFGQVQAEGKLTGERFNQLIERGVNIGPELAKSLGVAQSAIKGLISQSKISADEVSNAFQKMTSEGGQFFGATDRQSKTLSGSLSSLSDNVTILAAEIGKSLTPSLTDASNTFGDLTNQITNYLKNQREIAADPTKKRIEEINFALEDSYKVIDNLNTISSSDGIANLGKYLYGGAAGLEAYSKRVAETVGKLVAERQRLQEGLQQAADNKQADQNQNDAIAKQQKQAEKELAIQQEKLKKIKEAEDKAAQDRADKISDTEKQITQISIDQASAREATKALIAEQAREKDTEAAKKAATDALLAEQAAAEGAMVIRSNFDVANAQREDEFNETRRKAALDAAVAREQELTSNLLQAQATRADLLLQGDQAEQLRAQDSQAKLTATIKKGESDRLAAIRKAQKEEFDIAAQTAIATKNFDEQTYAQRMATAQYGLNALAGLMRSKNREAFELGKAAAIAQALITIPETAIKAYSSLAGIPLVGPVLGAAAAAAAIVAGTEQIRNIQNTRIAFAKGGVVPGQGNKDTVNALLTPGEVVVPKQNFEDIAGGFRGSIDSDIVQSILAGNQINAKILDTLLFGPVAEKLTTMVAYLEEIRQNTAYSAANSGTSIPDIVVDTISESTRNAPRVSSKPDDYRPRQKQGPGVNSDR